MFIHFNVATFKEWQEIKQHVKALQPSCIVIAKKSFDYPDTDIHSYEYPWLKPDPLRSAQISNLAPAFKGYVLSE